MPDSHPGAAGTIDRFIAAIEARDLDTATGLLAEDVVYDNVPIGPVHGREATGQVLSRTLGRASEVEWRVLHQVSDGDIVMNERLDRFRVGDRWIEIAVAGLFVVRDGSIRLWRDYFDLETYRRQQT